MCWDLFYFGMGSGQIPETQIREIRIPVTTLCVESVQQICETALSVHRESFSALMHEAGERACGEQSFEDSGVPRYPKDIITVQDTLSAEISCGYMSKNVPDDVSTETRGTAPTRIVNFLFHHCNTLLSSLFPKNNNSTQPITNQPICV